MPTTSSVESDVPIFGEPNRFELIRYQMESIRIANCNALSHSVVIQQHGLLVSIQLVIYTTSLIISLLQGKGA